jgi:hypothetical protein
MEWTPEEIQEVAERQKQVIPMIFLSLVAAVIPGATILTGIVLIYVILKLARAVRSSAAWVYVILAFIPLIGPLALLHLNRKTTRILQAHGVNVARIEAKRALAVVGLIIFFAITFIVVSILFMRFFLKDYKKVSVTGETIPELFPVLVITPDPGSDVYHAKTVYYKDLNGYLVEHPDYSFLVPDGWDEPLNAELKQNSRASKEPPDFTWESPDPWWAFFEVERLSDERQYLEVYHTWDDDRVNTSWYEATTKEIFPRHHQLYFGPGIALNMIPICFFITCALWIATFFTYKLIRKRY